MSNKVITIEVPKSKVVFAVAGVREREFWDFSFFVVAKNVKEARKLAVAHLVKELNDLSKDPLSEEQIKGYSDFYDGEFGDTWSVFYANFGSIATISTKPKPKPKSRSRF